MLGVRGVFAVEPNDAKAPDPRPKAEDAPLVGEATPVVVRGEMPLRGLALPAIEPSPPNRFAPEYVRADSGLGFSLLLLFELEVDKESLLELWLRPSISNAVRKDHHALTSSVAAIGCPSRLQFGGGGYSAVLLGVSVLRFKLDHEALDIC